MTGEEEDQELLRRIRADDLFVLSILSTLTRRRREADEFEYLAIKGARDDGISWSDIAGALGLESPQAARKRFGDLRELCGMPSPDQPTAVPPERLRT